MAKLNAVVRVYDPHAETEATIKEFQRSGFAMNQLSIVGKDYYAEDRVNGYAKSADRMKAWDELGMFWGGLSSLLLGSGFYFLPAIGPVIVFGPLVGWIVTALEGAVIAGEPNALSAGLQNAGIPKDSIMEYETALKSGKFIIIAHGTSDNKAKAEKVFDSPGRAQIVAIFGGDLRQRA